MCLVDEGEGLVGNALHLSEADFQRTGDYLQLMRQVLHKESYTQRTIQLLQMALLNDLHHLQSIEAEQQAGVQPSRQWLSSRRSSKLDYETNP